ncbi:MAG: ISAs1 family transposase [Flavobacteriaceae bacterium]
METNQRVCRSQEEFLEIFLELPNGIPSKGTIRWVFSAIDSNCFGQCLIKRVGNITNLSKGKNCCHEQKNALWRQIKQKKITYPHGACDNNLVLGQVRTATKSDEITAIPELLDIVDVSQTTVTIDAMGYQKEIAKKIIDQRADYILAVKENQPQLLENIKDVFGFSKSIATHTGETVGHDRIETRTCSMINDFQFLNEKTT